MARWFKYPFAIWQQIPEKFSGCYVIFEKGKPIYVGQSTDIYNRLFGYFSRQNKKAAPDIRIRYGERKTISPGDIDIKISRCASKEERIYREKRLIGRVNPILNIKDRIPKERRPMANLKPLDFLNTEEAAYYLKMSTAALKQCRIRGSGPPYYKLGKKVRYKIEDIEKWIKEAKRK